ncbi:hypothetical protein V9T40_000785 [Parthenolecanium corni]|uniref:beta-glucosidase n=1 Tax=Parthenolecanium corni TaxID=536013 RepID=A0AAN9TR30_9HEMI
MAFPDGFIFATASSSYQIEGAWNIDGKGENIWDRWSHARSECPKSDNGDVACDSYHKYKEDIFHLKDIGFDMYRFSISWARILPTGDITDINEAGVAYYHKLIDELHKNNIQPMITIYHWDLPQKLQDMGGWLNPLIVNYCEDYAGLLFKRFGDKVKWWITINEPELVSSGYEVKNYAPNLDLDSPANYIAAHNCLRAHGRIFRLYEKEYKIKQKGKISIALSGHCCLPKTNSKGDIDAANRAMLFRFGWFAHPIYSNEGDYPEIMRQTVDKNSDKEGRNWSRLPKFTADEIEAIKGSFDFFAINHYTSRLCSPGYPPDRKGTTYNKDMDVKMEVSPFWFSTSIPWLKVCPEGFRRLLVWIKDQYNNVPIFISENGVGDPDDLNPTTKESYHQLYLQQLLLAMNEDKCNVIGYTVWSLLDSFEWLGGYKYKFGIVHVDFSDPERARTQKKSASYFKQLLKTRDLPKIQMEN